MTVLLDPRNLKALQIAAGAGQWTRLVGRSFYIPSQSNPTECYVTSVDTCQCADSERHPEQHCKHSIAVNIVLALIETQPERTGLVATREDDDVISWDRPVHPRISDAEAGRIMERL